MLKRIIIAVLCIVLAGGAFYIYPFFPQMKLNNELKQGNYESPYIIRPIKAITVNSIDIAEYSVEVSDDTLCQNAADTLSAEIYKAYGKKTTVSNASDKIIKIQKTTDEEIPFSLEVKDGGIIITGNTKTGISRGIKAFFNEVLLKSEETFDFKDGYEYKKTFSDYITYEDFGAAGDGKTDDLDAIVKTHEYANSNNLTVFANETATYYIGGGDKTALIMTDTDWSTARFVIDDTNVENIGAWVFEVAPSQESLDLTGKISSLKATDKNIGCALDKECLIVLKDSNVKRYIRKGGNQNSGSDQADVIIVDENGNIRADAPLIWDFDAVTSVTAYPIDTKALTVTGGVFTTLANSAPSEYNYYARGILVKRSNTIVDGIYHDIKNEGETGAPYSAFINISSCTDVTVKESTFTGHKKYSTVGSGGSSVPMGTYDIGASTAINVKFINCKQTNDITDIDYWGIAGTNYCKNLEYDGCAFSRYDAHQGVLNATVKNSVLGHHGIKLIGSGTALIENTTVLSYDFIELRSDYGSTWNGELIIKNCKFYPTELSSHVIKAENSEDHDFGYTCYLPEKIVIDGLYVNRIGKSYLFNKVNKNHTSEDYNAEYPVVTPEEITVDNFNSLLFGDVSVSKNSAMFDVEIS